MSLIISFVVYPDTFTDLPSSLIWDEASSSGYSKKYERTGKNTANPAPSIKNALVNPTSSTIVLARGAVISGDNPKPTSTKPTAKPFFSGNHLATTVIGTPYAIPTPAPLITP